MSSVYVTHYAADSPSSVATTIACFQLGIDTGSTNTQLQSACTQLSYTMHMQRVTSHDLQHPMGFIQYAECKSASSLEVPGRRNLHLYMYSHQAGGTLCVSWIGKPNST